MTVNHEARPVYHHIQNRALHIAFHNTVKHHMSQNSNLRFYECKEIVIFSCYKMQSLLVLNHQK